MQFYDNYEIISENNHTTPPTYTVRRFSDKKIFTLKKLPYANLQPKEKHQIVQEVNIISEVDSPNIIKYHEHFIMKSETTLYVLMEHHSHDLSKSIRKYKNQGKHFSEEKIWVLMKQVILALKAIHKNKKGMILHRNIQPKSIFIDGNNIKLGNFRLVKKLDPEEQFATTLLQDTYYTAPEQTEDNGVFTAKSDIWAFGCLIYELCALKTPFPGQNLFQICKKIKEGQPKPLPSFYSTELSRVINRCLSKKIQDRPTIQELFGIPKINLLIRTNKLSEYQKKTIDKRSKNGALLQQIKILQARIQSLKDTRQLQQNKQNSNDNSNILPSQIKQKYSSSNKDEHAFSPMITFREQKVSYRSRELIPGLRRGISERQEQKEERNHSISTANIRNNTDRSSVFVSMNSTTTARQKQHFVEREKNQAIFRQRDMIALTKNDESSTYRYLNF